jgi:hypothetical protein
MGTLTTGVFLVGFAVALGADKQRSLAALGIHGCVILLRPANTDAFLDGALQLQQRFRWLRLWAAVQSLIFGKATCPSTLYSATHCCFWKAQLSAIGVYLLRITPDRPMAPAEKAGPALALLFAPLRESGSSFSSRLGVLRPSGGPVFHGLHVEVAGLSDDDNSRAYNSKPT